VTTAIIAFLVQLGLLLTGRWPWDRLGGAHLPTGLSYQQVFKTIFIIKGIWLVATFTIFLVLVARHRRSLVRLDRRTVAPSAITAVAVGIMSVVDSGASTAELPDQHLASETPGYIVAFLALAFAVSATVLRMRLAVSAIAGMVTGLTAPVSTRKVRDALSTALGDDSLEVVLWLSGRNGHVDVDGRPVEDVHGSERTAYEVTDRLGQPLARLVADPALRRHEHLVSAPVRVIGVVLETPDWRPASYPATRRTRGARASLTCRTRSPTPARARLARRSSASSPGSSA
jgi:hypothetical protein